MNKGNALRLGVIIGSTRQGRFGPTVARWIAEEAARRGDMEVDLIDLADAGLPEALGNETPPRITALGARFAAADAFVVVTPEYNHGYPAALKSAIDWLASEWHGKPVGFVSYGGRSGGIRAVEQLRQVFVEMHAMTIREAVSFHDVWKRFDADGRPSDRVGAGRAARAMLERLRWWGEALREARVRRPYAA